MGGNNKSGLFGTFVAPYETQSASYLSDRTNSGSANMKSVHITKMKIFSEYCAFELRLFDYIAIKNGVINQN